MVAGVQLLNEVNTRLSAWGPDEMDIAYFSEALAEIKSFEQYSAQEVAAYRKGRPVDDELYAVRARTVRQRADGLVEH